MVEFALYAVGVFVALKVAIAGVAWTRIMALRFRDPKVVLTARDNLAPELAPILSRADEVLSGLGFEYSHSQWAQPPGALESPRPYEIFAHRDSGSYASVCPSVLYNGNRVFDVLFTTPFEDGTTVATGDSILHLATALPPSWEFHDHYLNDVSEQWRLHLESLGRRAVAAEPMHLLPEEFAAREDADLKAAFSSLEEQGAAVREDESGHLRLRPLAAWRMVLKVQSGGRRVAIRRREKLLAGDAEPVGAPQVAADIYAFVRNEANERGQTQSRRFKTVLFLVSMVGFVLAFGWLWSWRTVPLLLMVVLIHELGHLAGMALFGYRDRQILFVPFLGAAAIGRSEDATPFQKLIIYLLGPIPGIALGFACLRMGTIAGGWFWTELGIIAILINYLNLLPLTPLDGGRVVETILLSRFPRAQALFLFASACLFGLGGMVAGDPILLILAAFMALSLPTKWKWGGAARSISRTLPADAGKRERLLAIFETLNQPRFGKLQSQGKLQMAKGLLDYLQERRPGLGASFAGAALYVATLIAPVIGYGGYLASEAGVLEGDAAPAMFEGPALPESRESDESARDIRTALARGDTTRLADPARAIPSTLDSWPQ